jgi:hypothetical protein
MKKEKKSDVNYIVIEIKLYSSKQNNQINKRGARREVASLEQARPSRPLN